MYKIIAIIVTLFAICNGYPQPSQPYPVNNNDYSSPTPYNYGYQTNDGRGTTTTRQESGDGSGAVRGSYSYTDAYGLNRVVEYIADSNGFRAWIKTNEPGTETSAPADVVINASPVSPARAPIAPVVPYPAPAPAPVPAPSQLPLWPDIQRKY